MASRLHDWLRIPLRRPRLGLLLAVLLGLLGYLGWLGGRALWARWDRAEAERAIAAYDFGEARRRLARGIRLRPDDPALYLLAARTARRDGDVDGALEHLDRHRDLVGESSPEETLERALRIAQQGKVREVLDYLIESLELHHPQSEYILEALAMGCVQGYQLNRALFWTDELLEKWPNNAIGRLHRAQTIDTQGSREKALEQLQGLVADYPRFGKARLSLADLLFKSQKYREALTEYASLLRQRPGEMLPLLGVASAYERLGSMDEARPLIQELLERFPDDSEVLLEGGRFALTEKKPAEAERLLRRALERAPNDHEIHRELGACLAQLGRGGESRKHLDRSKEIEADLILLEKTLAAMGKAPNDPKPRREAGEICLRNGQVAEGLRWLNGVLDMVPDDKPTHRILANFYTSRGEAEPAAFHDRKAR